MNKQQSTIYQGIICEDKTDIDKFYKQAFETETTQWFFQNKGNMPQYGDIILVVSTAKPGIKFICQVLSLKPQTFQEDMNGECESDIKDRSARKPNKKSYYIVVKAISANGLNIYESWKRGELSGCRQSTFKVIPREILKDEIQHSIKECIDVYKR